MNQRPDDHWWPLLWDAGVVALAQVGADRRYRAVNAALCRLLDADAETLLGWSYERVGHPLDLDAELDAFVRLAEGAGAVSYARRFRTARDREFTATVQAVAGAEGAVLQVIIPGAACATKPSLHAQVLEQVAAALSHDAQEPVRHLGVSAGVLLECLGPLVATKERERSLLLGMERHAVRLNRQLRALVRFARVGTPVIDPVAHPLRPVVERALAQVPIPGSVRIEDTIPADIQVRCDRHQLTTALVELLRNAIAPHAPGRPTVVALSAGIAGGALTISVRDDGVGIAATDQPRLFRLFAAGGPGAGPGIGLALVRVIAESHGGSVRVESAQGIGTTVVVTLPR
jgi:two-component system OmpR family sensor kinase